MYFGETNSFSKTLNFLSTWIYRLHLGYNWKIIIQIQRTAWQGHDFFLLPELNDSKGLKSGSEFEFTDRFSTWMELGREASVEVLKPRCLFHFNRAKLSRLSPRRRSNRSRKLPFASFFPFHSSVSYLISIFEKENREKMEISWRFFKRLNNFDGCLKFAWIVWLCNEFLVKNWRWNYIGGFYRNMGFYFILIFFFSRIDVDSNWKFIIRRIYYTICD